MTNFVVASCNVARASLDSPVLTVRFSKAPPASIRRQLAHLGYEFSGEFWFREAHGCVAEETRRVLAKAEAVFARAEAQDRQAAYDTSGL